MRQLKQLILLFFFFLCVVASAQEKLRDIDSSIPLTYEKQQHIIAVVIGNGNYESADIPKGEYAHRDAESFGTYLSTMFGVPQENVLLEKDITESRFKRLFGAIDKESILNSKIITNETELIVYFSGHGAPDSDFKNGYLICKETELNDIKGTSYSYNSLIENLNKLQVKSTTLILDACFSGIAGNGKTIVPNSSPLGARVKQGVLRNGVIISASDNNQIASWMPEQKHGLFTYFFLLGLGGAADADQDGKITSKEIKDFTNDNTRGVPYWAQKKYSRSQQVQVFSSADDNTIFRYPADITEKIAKKRRDTELARTAEKDAWKRATQIETIAGFNEYLKKYPESENSKIASKWIADNSIIPEIASKEKEKIIIETKTITIGEQEWVIDHLRTFKFANGNLIPDVDLTFDIRGIEKGKKIWGEAFVDKSPLKVTNPHSWYNLFNWWTVVDTRGVCPTGFHVPTDAEWDILLGNFGGNDTSKKFNIDNSFKVSNKFFEVLGIRSPSGWLGGDIEFYGKEESKWWSSTKHEKDPMLVWTRSINHKTEIAKRELSFTNDGLAILCVKD